MYESWKLLRQVRNIFYSVWSIHPHCCSLLTPTTHGEFRGHFINEKRQSILLTWDQTMRKVVNNPSSFMFLFWGRVEF